MNKIAPLAALASVPARLSISNDSRIRVNRLKIRQAAYFFLGMASRYGKCRWDEISLVLCGNSGSLSMNRAFLGHDYPTDVITFSYLPIPGDRESIAGEIMVNVELAIGRGNRLWGADQELALYIAHGCDHLTGADDATPLQRRRMRARELRWVRAAGDKGLLAGLVTDQP